MSAEVTETQCLVIRTQTHTKLKGAEVIPVIPSYIRIKTHAIVTSSLLVTTKVLL